MKSKSWRAASATIVAAGVCAASVAAVASTPAAAAKTLPTVKLAYVAPVSDLQIPLMAEQLGFFKKYGVNVEVESLPQTEAIPAIVAGQIQMASFQGPGPEVQYVDGTKLQWLMQWEQHSNSVLLGRSGATSVNGLAGKTVGITTVGTSSQVLTQLALKEAHVTANLQPLGSVTAMVAAFQAGSVQAAILTPPQDLTLLQQIPGSKILVNYGKEFPWPGGGLASLSSWTASHKSTTIKVLEGMIATINYIKKHPSAAAKVIAKADDQTMAEATAGFDTTLTLLKQMKSLAPSVSVEREVLSIIRADYPQAKFLEATKLFNSTYYQAAAEKVPFVAGK